MRLRNRCEIAVINPIKMVSKTNSNFKSTEGNSITHSKNELSTRYKRMKKDLTKWNIDKHVRIPIERCKFETPKYTNSNELSQLDKMTSQKILKTETIEGKIGTAVSNNSDKRTQNGKNDTPKFVYRYRYYKYKAKNPQGPQGRPRHCKLCDFVGKFPAKVRDHIIKMHSTEPRELKRVYKCEQCCTKYTTKGALRIHMRSGHKTVDPFKCEKCDKEFYYSNTFKNHLKTHWNAEEREHICTFCNKTFNIAQNLKVHLRTHTKERPYLCNICSRTLADSNSLKNHVATHTGERNYKCEHCGNEFVQNSARTAHIRRVHTKEIRFYCEFCNKGYTDKVDCVRHTRVHTGEKPYKCNYCELTFRRPNEVQLHTRVHTGERPFECKECEKKFVSSTARRTHMKTHTAK